MRNGRRVFLRAVEVLDADLCELLTADILEAIHQHLETLAPEKRVKPPRPPEPRKQPVNAQRGGRANGCAARSARHCDTGAAGTNTGESKRESAGSATSPVSKSSARSQSDRW